MKVSLYDDETGDLIGKSGVNYNGGTPSEGEIVVMSPLLVVHKVSRRIWHFDDQKGLSVSIYLEPIHD